MSKKGHKSCKKGYPCGAGCISVKYACRKEFTEGVSVSIDGTRKVIMNNIEGGGIDTPVEPPKEETPKEAPKQVEEPKKETPTPTTKTPSLGEGMLKMLDSKDADQAIDMELLLYDSDGDVWNNESKMDYMLNDRVKVLKKRLKELDPNTMGESMRKEYADKVEAIENSAKVRLHMMNPDKYPSPGDKVLERPLMEQATKGLAGNLLKNTKEKYPTFDEAVDGLTFFGSKREFKTEVDDQVKKDAEKIGMNPNFVKEEMLKFDSLTKGGMKIEPARIIKDTDRPYMQSTSDPNNRDAKLNIGRQTDGMKSRATLFHELGHQYERSNPRVRKLANSMVDEMKTSDQLEKMSKLTGIKAYGDEEKAYPSKFKHPYTAKLYPKDNEARFKPYDTLRTTEVTSMAMEKFTTLQSLKKFHKEDPDHFYYMIGVLKDVNAL